MSGFDFKTEDKDGNQEELIAANKEEQDLMDAIAKSLGSFGAEGIVFVDNSEEGI